MNRKQNSVEIFFDVACPYAYLAVFNIEEICCKTNTKLIPKPLLLGGLYKLDKVPNGNILSTISQAKKTYKGKELQRFAQYRGLDLNFHPNYPLSTLMMMRCLIATKDENLFIPLAKRIYKAYWVDNKDITNKEVILEILDLFGLDAEKIYLRAQSEEIKRELTERTTEGNSRGLFGVPTFIVNESIMIYGQDRLEELTKLLGGKVFEPQPIRLSGISHPPHKVDFYFDFSSPFTFLASLHTDEYFGSENVNWVPVLLGAIFKKIGTPGLPIQGMSENKRKYFDKDLKEQAKRLNVDLRFPSFFPINSVYALRAVLALGANTKIGKKVIKYIFKACWIDHRNIGKVEILEKVLEEAGVDGKGILEKCKDPKVKQSLFKTTDSAVDAGIFGLPSFVIHKPNEDVLLFGNDKITWAVLESRRRYGQNESKKSML